MFGTTKELKRLRSDYIALMRNVVVNSIYRDPPLVPLGGMDLPADTTQERVYVVGDAFGDEARAGGRDWPSVAHTMIGELRMQNLQQCCERVLQDRVPGDFIETGVWRGGACIFMRSILHAYGDTARRVFVADSFEGLPRPDAESYPKDEGDIHHTFGFLAVSLEQVQQNFARYGFLDDQVKFLKGWFKDTLPGAAIDRLAILRLDGDMYESTMDALVALYHKVSKGGFVIVDDYHAVPACREAVHDFLDARGLPAQIEEIDGIGVFWRVA